eukprot:1486808-Prymnesium_polylepis.1
MYNFRAGHGTTPGCSAICVRDPDFYLLEPEYGPDYYWRCTGGMFPPPASWPLWYFLDHSSDPSLQISTNLYKILTNRDPACPDKFRRRDRLRSGHDVASPVR